jgi:hypothetical protein
MTNSIDRDQWLNVTSESQTEYNLFFMILNFALGRNRTCAPRVPEPKRTPLGYILPILYFIFIIIDGLNTKPCGIPSHLSYLSCSLPHT